MAAEQRQDSKAHIKVKKQSNGQVRVVIEGLPIAGNMMDVEEGVLGPGIVKGHLSTRESSVPPGSCFCSGSARDRHLMGFEEDWVDQSGVRVVCAIRLICGLT